MTLRAALFRFFQRIGAKNAPENLHSQRAAKSGRINPATGLPLINGSTVDVGGNPLGMNRINQKF